MLDASVALTGPFRTAAAVPHHLVVGLEEVRSTFCSLLLVYARREAIHSIIAVLCVPARGCSILVASNVAVSYGGDKSGEGIHRREQSPEQEVPVRRRAAEQSRAERRVGRYCAGGETGRAVLSHMCLGLGSGLGIAHRKLR